MTTISVAIATFNEEDKIGKCLESVYGWVAEIVLVDGSSTDRTVGIAKKYKAKVLIKDNPPIFHINKQRAIDECHSDWILQLDADEVVTQELKDEIIKTVNQQPINGYWIPRKNYFLGKWLSKGGQYPDYTLRLYKKGKGRLPCKSVHEQAEVMGRMGYLKNPLLHYPYANFSEYLEHFNRYTDIFAKEYKESKLRVSAVTFITYLLIKPLFWFVSTFIRHKGFMDGFAGFLFSFFSSLRFPVSYIKYWRNYGKKEKN